MIKLQGILKPFKEYKVHLIKSKSVPKNMEKYYSIFQVFQEMQIKIEVIF